MPYHVEKTDKCPASKPYGVIKDTTGEVMGCHETKKDADAQIAALYANEPGAKEKSRERMKYGTNVHVTFSGTVEYDNGVWVDVKDGNGVTHRFYPVHIALIPMKPDNWPPQLGDVWRYLDITLVIEGSDDQLLVIPSNGEGGLDIDSALKEWPGMHLIARAALNSPLDSPDNENWLEELFGDIL